MKNKLRIRAKSLELDLAGETAAAAATFGLEPADLAAMQDAARAAAFDRPGPVASPKA